MNKLINSQRNFANSNLNLQLPPTLTQTSVMEDSNIGSSMASPNMRKLKKKQSINSKFSKFDLHDRSQFGQTQFQQIQNQSYFKEGAFHKKTVRFSPSASKETDQSFLKNMPLFKQFQEDNNFSQIECSQIPKKQNYQCQFQQIVSPRKLKRQTSFHQNNGQVDNLKDIRISGRKSSFQIISQESNSGSHNSSISQSKKFDSKKLLQSKNINKTPNLQVIHQFSNKNGNLRPEIQQFQNSKFQQSNIQSELQHLKDNHTIEIEEVLSQNQSQIQPTLQNQSSNKVVQSNLCKQKTTDKFSKDKLHSIKQEKNQTSSSSSSISSPKLLSFGQIQTPKFPKDKQLVSRLKNTCERVLNMNKIGKQTTKQNDKNSLNINQNQNKSGFSLNIMKIQNTLPDLKSLNKRNLSTVQEGHQNQSRYYDQKTFILADELKINAFSQTETLSSLQSSKVLESKIAQLKQYYCKKINILQSNQQNLRNQIINLTKLLKTKQVQNKKLIQQNISLKQDLNQKKNKLQFNNQEIRNLKAQISTNITLNNNNNHSQSNLQNQISQSYKLSKKQEQWSYLQFKYQKQIKSLQAQLADIKHKLFQLSGSQALNFVNTKTDQMNQKIQQSIQFLKYHEQALYQNMIKVKKEQDAILREWRELDKIKKNMKNSCNKFQEKNYYY